MYLGIDIGTTKVAAAIVDRHTRLLASVSRPHAGDRRAAAGCSEQDADVLLGSALAVVRALPGKLRKAVQAVGVTGQMHGVVLVDRQCRPVSRLITWQDQRCGQQPGLLARLHDMTGYVLRTGYGCATLAWLAQHRALPRSAAAASTIHDLLVARLCGLSRPVTDPTDAASWGLFDLRRLEWDMAAVRKAGIPPSFLPQVVPCGGSAGHLTCRQARLLGLPAGVPVMVAMGDNQASLVATLGKPSEELALTLGTGGQLSAVVSSMPVGRPLPADATFEYRPYPGGRYLAAAASLCGGSAWRWLADSVTLWQHSLGLPAPLQEELHQRLNRLGLKARGGLVVTPSFLGERHAPGLRGSISGIGATGLDIGELAAGLSRGIVANLRDMLPPRVLAGRKRVVGSGNALRLNPLLQRAAREVIGLPLALSSGREEAACGAAMMAGKALER